VAEAGALIVGIPEVGVGARLAMKGVGRCEPITEIDE
jgi:hypothetical protein